MVGIAKFEKPFSIDDEKHPYISNLETRADKEKVAEKTVEVGGHGI